MSPQYIKDKQKNLRVNGEGVCYIQQMRISFVHCLANVDSSSIRH